jgi:hypothetical protein
MFQLNFLDQIQIKTWINPILTNSLHPKSDSFPLSQEKKDSNEAQMCAVLELIDRKTPLRQQS